ncbi:MAG: OmpA family protein [Bacteroidota bacterium]
MALIKIVKKLIFVLIPPLLQAQNLVPNGDFETNERFFSFRSLGDLSNWKSANRCTPDYLVGKFHETGNQDPHSGNKYVGIVTSIDERDKNNIYTEYIQSSLLRPLLKDAYYCLSLYVSRAENRRYALDHLEFNLSEKRPTDNHKDRPMPINRYGSLYSQNDTILANDKDWILICATYKATGKERYLTIGKFDPIISLMKIDNRKHKIANFYSAYYYIDDVSLVLMEDSMECECSRKNQRREENLEEKSVGGLDILLVGEKWISNNVYFEKNKAEILAESQTFLNEIIVYFRKNPSLSVEISGHTDQTGDEKANMFLSENRAKAIVNYLVENGVQSERLKWKGYGGSMPIADNNTEEGRKKNRRVEFKILAK